MIRLNTNIFFIFLKNIISIYFSIINYFLTIHLPFWEAPDELLKEI